MFVHTRPVSKHLKSSQPAEDTLVLEWVAFSKLFSSLKKERKYMIYIYIIWWWIIILSYLGLAGWTVHEGNMKEAWIFQELFTAHVCRPYALFPSGYCVFLSHSHMRIHRFNCWTECCYVMEVGDSQRTLNREMRGEAGGAKLSSLYLNERLRCWLPRLTCG